MSTVIFSRRFLIKGGASLAGLGAMVRPAHAAPVTIFTKTFNSSEAGWQGYHMRMVIQPADLTAAPGATLMRITYQFETGSSAAAIDGSWISNYGTGNAYNFNGNQVQEKFGGANNITGINGQTTVVGDWVPFTTYNPAVALVVSFHVSGTEATLRMISGQSNTTTYYLSFDNSETGVTTPSTMANNTNVADFVSKIEMDTVDKSELLLRGVGR